jgi:myosin-5
MAPDSAVIHSAGTKVWIRHDAESWVAAEVVKVEADGGLIVREDGSGLQRALKPHDAPLQNTDSRVEVRLVAGCCC